MSFILRSLPGILWAALVPVLAWPVTAVAQAPRVQQQATSNVSNYPPVTKAPETSDHPLTPVIVYAQREQKYLGQTVQDFTCRLVKRERIKGYLQDTHFIDMQVREGAYQGRQVIRPLSIYLHFLAPKSVVDRAVIFVEGRNDGKMLVRNGGKHFDYVLAKIDPASEAAQEETLVPVAEIGFNRLLGRMIDVLERHRQVDTLGNNTRAERISGAKINNRPCTVIRITHPEYMEGLEFHRANVFVDDELHAPVRVDYSGWPKNSTSEPPLIAEYTYTNLQLNVGLSDGHFNPARLRRPGD